MCWWRRDAPASCCPVHGLRSQPIPASPCKIAMEEIRAGKVHWDSPETQRSPVELASQLLDKAMQAGTED